MKETADTVVVGGGSAGAVIAARATENGTREVLLLEAGPDYPAPMVLPSDLRDGTRNSMLHHDWKLWYRPVKGQSLFFFPRGRVVGGSSAVNTCIALRGQPFDYDEWAARGLPEWSWAKCLPAFKRLENDLDIVNEWHSQDGPVPIRRHPPAELTPWNAAFVETCAALGYAECKDTNDPTTTGYGPHAMNKVDGERMSAARCYLTESVRARKNFRLRPDTIVRRLRFERGRVVGLEVETLGRVYDIRAKKVILSAGAIASPCILLRSGVGPRKEIERLGLTLERDLPGVGARLLDHPGCAIFLRPRRGVLDLAHPIVQTVLRYTSEGSDCPNDMQLQPGSFVPFPRFEVPILSLALCVGKPRGHGRLSLTSANPRVAPRIDTEFLENDEDRKRAVAGISLAWRCVSQGAMKELATPFWPGRRVLESTSAIDGFIRRITGSGYHPCGTVPMGADDDPAAALDEYGRVRGIEGLFVADASIMPTIPTSNTNVPTLMIGERFGAWLRDGII
jgi:choline dehydrogenase